MLGEKCQRTSHKRLAPPFDNHIFTRITQIYQILANNNTLFTKAPPSQQQLKLILEHCYNCYDQLDFIYLDYSSQPINYLDPKALAEYTQKIFRSAKYLINHLSYWYDAFQLEIVKRMNEIKLNIEQHSCTRPHCFVCLNNINQMKLQEAKESILGPMQWRQIYEQQLREEKEALKKLQIFEKRQERQDYVSSVNFLARIIREMEDSAKNYERLAQTVENQNTNDDHTLFVLQELIGKLKVKLGQKYKLKFQSKLKSMLKKMDQKNNHLGVVHEMMMAEQFNLKIEPGEHKARASAIVLQESSIRKLKEENRRLLAERNELNQQIDSLKETVIKKHTSGDHSRSVSRKNTMQVRHDKIEQEQDNQNQLSKARNTLPNKIQNRQKGISPQKNLSTNYLQSKMRSKKRNFVGRMSAFHLKRIQTRKSQLSEFLDKTIEQNNADQLAGYRRQAEEEENHSLVSKNSITSSQLRQSEQETGIKEIGCQWEQSIYDSLNVRQLISVKSHSKNRKPTLAKVQKENEESIKSSKKQRKSKLDSLKNLMPSLGATKSVIRDNTIAKYISKDSRTLRQQKSAAQLRDNYGVQDHVQEHPRESVSSINFEHTTINDKNKNAMKRIKNSQDDIKNKSSYQQKGRANDKIALDSKNGYGILMKTAKLQTNLETKNDHILNLIKLERNKDLKMGYLKARVATQQSATVKKDKIIRNIIFKPEHLTIFGGVSQSYSYQNWKADLKIQKLSEDEQKTLKGLKIYIQNLKSFKNGLYQSIVSFLSSPFSTIQKNEVEFKPLNNQMTEKLLLKMLLFHKKKCGCVGCGHLQHFCEIIGYYIKD